MLFSDGIAGYGPGGQQGVPLRLRRLIVICVIDAYKYQRQIIFRKILEESFTRLGVYLWGYYEEIDS